MNYFEFDKALDYILIDTGICDEVGYEEEPDVWMTYKDDHIDYRFFIDDETTDYELYLNYYGCEIQLVNSDDYHFILVDGNIVGLDEIQEIMTDLMNEVALDKEIDEHYRPVNLDELRKLRVA